MSGCAANTADLMQGTSGLAGALPGGDGRALAAYKAEFNANALAGMDTLMLRTDEVWRRDNRTELARLYSDKATLLTPDGKLLTGGEAVREYVSAQLPTMATLDTWRDEFGASGIMTFMYGRYDADSNEPSGDNKGIHLTIAMRDRFNWQIRSKVYLSFDGSGVPTAPELLTGDPLHVSPDSIRAAFGVRALNGQNDRAEWQVNSYFAVNSFMSAWQYAWNNDEFDDAVAMMAPGVVVRFPYDIPAVGKTNAAYSLQRLLPAVGDVTMSILDFDMSERLSFCLGTYTLNAGGQELTGYYMAVIGIQDEGPELRSLVFSGAGANEGSTEGSLDFH